VILQHIESEAAVLQIRIDVKDPRRRGAARERARAAAGQALHRRRLRPLAKEFSDDPLSRGRGGQFAIYERGADDQLLKQAAFESRWGRSRSRYARPWASTS
jgi:hypothetical protein